MELSLEQQIDSGGAVLPPTRQRGLSVRMLRPVVGVGLAVGLLAACGGGGGDRVETASDPSTTTSTADDLESTTSETTVAEIGDGCVSAGDLNKLVWNNELQDGVQIPDAESVQAAQNPERALGRDVIGCIYEFMYTEQFTSTAGDVVQNTGDLTLEYRSGSYEDADAQVSDLFQRYTQDGANAQLLNFGDTSSFVLQGDGAYEYRYVDGDRVCFGRASGSFIGMEAEARLNIAANILAAKVGCELDVDVLTPSDETTPVTDGSENARPENMPTDLAPGDVWTDDMGFRHQVQEDGSVVNLGQGA